ncbi:hypothetical protein AAFC00_001828 [Neodothiora populina]|uniref:Palmitoyltransferase pfa4 n=1 Tax=Neodothiora populina TaxID=2781224 RepID=A0ABR3PQ98_9PEZI
MTYLEYFLMQRAQVLWYKRDLPSYLGPSALQLAHLFVLIIVNSLVLFALFVLYVRTLWCLGANTTTIEGWEIERHATLVRRARHLGGFLDGPSGTRIKITKQEFPYDIGIYQNLAQGMGGHLHTWLWPFARTPTMASGLAFPGNGFEDPGTSWPPPDPDRMFQFPTRTFDPALAFTQSMDPMDFRQRQDADLLRQRQVAADGMVRRRQPFHTRYDQREARDQYEVEDDVYADQDETEDLPNDSHSITPLAEGEESWRNSEGERLADFGVDEDIEFYDEDDLPLSEIMKRRKMQHKPDITR